MTRRFLTAFLTMFAALALAGCWEEEVVVKPAAIELTREAAGHYCQMTVLDHHGPKAQIHLAGLSQPVWFTQIRDAVAFTLLPEETSEVAAFYVTDMSRASWDEPPRDNWIPAETAFYVIESQRKGGMGGPEAVPFGAREAADKFAANNGGRVVTYAEIPKDYVLSPVDVPDTHGGAEG